MTDLDPLFKYLPKYYICDPDFTNVKVVDLMTWAHWMEDPHKRIVDRKEMVRGFVSTVFMGFDLGWGLDDTPPLLFETAIFAPGYACDKDRLRYTTIEEARKGHAKAVETLKASPRVWDEL